ncbi:flocculation protein FLO11-like isoform X2 [Phoenix dactylifera]|uniref:Flocculation protein FLO11-like isoform X2 n=1 Tax=Phoenix dactylifera TaxID=42345 RepID=A0A8B7D0V1_PHODC|nr:flocculation protein FLO11-like isoform X2 [Phoenix dactylifera]
MDCLRHRWDQQSWRGVEQTISYRLTLAKAIMIDASEHQLSSTAPTSSSNVRSVSTTTKASRLSVSQSENGQSTRPTRSSSATRPSLFSTNSPSFLSNNNRTSHLNASSASLTSRPTTPGKRPTTASTTKANLAPASRPVPLRPSTPSKTRTSSSSSGDKPRQLQNSRPSTPTGRPHVRSTSSDSSSSTSAARSNSRPSTPTRRNPTTPAPAPTTSNSRPSTPNRRTPMPAPAPAMARCPSAGRIPTTNSRNPAPRLRPSSPGPRARVPPAQSLALPDFLHKVQPNPRTKLPERPISSASKQRPGAPLTVQAKPNLEAAASMSLNRGRLSHNSPKERPCSNGQDVRLPEIHKSVASESAVGRPTKPSSSTESTGFGRTISKKSLDMALRHMDIRPGMGGIRGASLFPQSIRPTTSEALPVPTADKAAPHDDERMSDLTGREDGNHNGMISSDSNLAISEDGEAVVGSAERESGAVRVNELDIYESSRYDAILLKEDSKNFNWLHSIEDNCNQSPVFDHRFEPLPEPFSLI